MLFRSVSGPPRSPHLTAALLAAALVAYPFLDRWLHAQTVHAVTDAMIYVLLALGLNIVVGYAGLLDLGYAAFFAIGAYTAAWFASLQFEQVTFHLGSVGISRSLPGIHISIWLILLVAGLLTLVAGILMAVHFWRVRKDGGISGPV